MTKPIRLITATLAAAWLAWGATPAAADPARDAVLDHYRAQARADGAAKTGFSAARGEALFRQRFTTGKPDTPSCTACHTNDPRAAGRTRAGKAIAPLAVSATPNRYTDLKKTEKWFRRNCKSVLGRACSATEKGDFITFMTTR